MVDIPYVCLYASYIKTLEPFNDAQRGRIMTAMLDYAVNGSEPKFSGSERFIWPTIKDRIDRDIAAYIARTEKNRANGAKGGRPKKQSDEPEKQPENPKENEEPENPKNPPVFSETQKSQGEGEGKGEGEGDINNLCASGDAPNPPAPPPSPPKQPKVNMAEVDALFEHLWKMYPEKKGKGQVSEAKRKALFSIGQEEMERAIGRYLQELKKDAAWRKPQNGSTFFNSGYVDYLDANFVPTAGIPAQPKQPTVSYQKQTKADELAAFYEMAAQFGEGG